MPLASTLSFILASGSSARRELLGRLPLRFQVISPDIDETPEPDEAPEKLAIRLAEAKARAVAAKLTAPAVIIAADQVIMCGNTRLDKPETFEAATKQLELSSGKRIESYTGLCVFNLYHTGDLNLQTALEKYSVQFRELSPAVITDYLRHDMPLHCAGSIKAEGLGMTLFTEMSGRDPTALLGLPVMQLTEMLLAQNIYLLGA